MAVRHDSNAASKRLVQLFRAAIHELNTPISILQHTLETLEQGSRTPETQAAIQTIRGQVVRLISVMEDLHLRLGIVSGELVSRPAPVDLAAVLREQIEILEEQHPARSIARRGSSSLVRADQGILGTLIWLLLNDALTLSDADPVVVEIELDEGADAVTLRIIVAGRALAGGRQDLLDPERPGPGLGQYGLGLGLEVAYQLAQQMGGSFQTEPLGGTPQMAGAVLTLTLSVWSGDEHAR